MKRTKQEIVNSFGYYAAKGAKNLLNNEQQKIVRPYMWRYKIAVPLVLVQVIFVNIVEKTTDFISNVLDKLDDITMEIQYKVDSSFSKDPRIIRGLHEKFIDELVDHEDDEGKERFDEYKSIDPKRMKVRKNKKIKK